MNAGSVGQDRRARSGVSAGIHDDLTENLRRIHGPYAGAAHRSHHRESVWSKVMKTALLLVCGTVFLSSGAYGQPVTIIGEPVPTARVTFADLNIASSVGQERLRGRIQAAASTLCLENNIDSLKVHMIRQNCYNHAVGDGYRQMDQLITSARVGSSLAAAAVVLHHD
jgi:UrcA family protein